MRVPVLLVLIAGTASGLQVDVKLEGMVAFLKINSFEILGCLGIRLNITVSEHDP